MATTLRNRTSARSPQGARVRGRGKGAGERKRGGSLPDHHARRARLAKVLSAANLPALLVTNPNDVGYLSGFMGGDSYALVGAGKPVIVSDFRYQEELEPLREEMGGSWEVVIRTGPMAEAVAAVLKQSGLGKVGVQAEHMTLALRQALSRGLKAGLVETSGLVMGLRAVKDAHEIGLIRKAVAIQEAALDETLTWLDRRLAKGPVSELEIAASLEAGMKCRGSPKPGFETIIAARANGSHPHYRPGPQKLGRNQGLLIDWGATYAGYHGDMTRVVCWGKWPKQLAEIYAIVLEAHEAAAAALRPGALTREIDKIARDIITGAGYGEQYGHGLGHGIGLDGHEEPRLSHMMAGTPLEPGHMVTVEPGIYLPGVGGVRIEDDYLITARGSENLCSLPRSLKWATRR